MAFTPITSAVDPFGVAILNEIIGAINRRLAASGGSPLALVVEGDEVQTPDFWSGLQSAVEALAQTFVDHTAAGPGPGDGFSGLDAAPLFTLASWRTAAGLNAAGFTAYSGDDPDDGGEPTYQDTARGDIADGLWLLGELQAGLEALKKTLGNPAWDAGGEYTGGSGNGYSLVSLAAAQQDSKDHFDDAANHVTVLGPAAASGYEYIPGSPEQWTAYLSRNSSFGRWTWAELGALVKTIEFYNIGSDDGFDEFNTSGDFPGGYTPGKLYLYDTVANVTGTTGLSARCGKRPPGNYPAWGAGGVYAGYGASDTPVVVIEWTFDP